MFIFMLHQFCQVLCSISVNPHRMSLCFETMTLIISLYISLVLMLQQNMISVKSTYRVLKHHETSEEYC